MVADLKAILQLEVPIIVDIGSRMLTLHDVLKFSTGSIIELPKGAEEELELKVNNKTLATGVAVKVGENFGILISYIGDIQERLDALAAQSQAESPADAPPPTAADDPESMADDVLDQLAGMTDQASTEPASAAADPVDEDQAA